MMRNLILLILAPMVAFGQSPYKIKPIVDVPVTIAGTALTAYGFYKIGQKGRSDSATIMALDPNDLIKLNRPATRNYDPKAGNLSHLFFYGGFIYPVVLMLDDDIRRDAGTVGLLYMEALSITGTNYAFVAGNFDKYRPYAYNPEAPLDKRMNSGSKSSFPGGHPSVTATATFFTAKVFSDYHPDSKAKYLFYSVAAITTLSNAYLRYEGGYHFPTDLMVGVSAGTLVGILVPALHKTRRSETSFQLSPFSNEFARGLTLRKKF